MSDAFADESVAVVPHAQHAHAQVCTRLGVGLASPECRGVVVAMKLAGARCPRTVCIAGVHNAAAQQARNTGRLRAAVRGAGPSARSTAWQAVSPVRAAVRGPTRWCAPRRGGCRTAQVAPLGHEIGLPFRASRLGKSREGSSGCSGSFPAVAGPGACVRRVPRLSNDCARPE